MFLGLLHFTPGRYPFVGTWTSRSLYRILRPVTAIIRRNSNNYRAATFRGEPCPLLLS